MSANRLTYWLPRVFVILFVLSLVLPAPDFIVRMGRGAFTLWLARLLWVIGVPLMFCLILIVVARFRR